MEHWKARDTKAIELHDMGEVDSVDTGRVSWLPSVSAHCWFRMVFRWCSAHFSIARTLYIWSRIFIYCHAWNALKFISNSRKSFTQSIQAIFSCPHFCCPLQPNFPPFNKASTRAFPFCTNQAIVYVCEWKQKKAKPIFEGTYMQACGKSFLKSDYGRIDSVDSLRSFRTRFRSYIRGKAFSMFPLLYHIWHRKYS